MSSTSPAELAAVQHTARYIPQEVLTYHLGAEEYGVDILSVQEIRAYEKPTRIANAPADMLGVVDLRGTIVPIHDLRIRLGCDAAEVTAATVVIVLNICDTVVGVVVDSVSDVIALAKEDVKEAPKVGGAADAFVTGIAAISDAGERRTVVLVDAPALLGLQQA